MFAAKHRAHMEAEETVAELQLELAKLKEKFASLSDLSEQQLGYVSWFAKKIGEYRGKWKVKPMLGADVKWESVRRKSWG